MKVRASPATASGEVSAYTRSVDLSMSGLDLLCRPFAANLVLHRRQPFVLGPSAPPVEHLTDPSLASAPGIAITGGSQCLDFDSSLSKVQTWVCCTSFDPPLSFPETPKLTFLVLSPLQAPGNTHQVFFTAGGPTPPLPTSTSVAPPVPTADGGIHPNGDKSLCMTVVTTSSSRAFSPANGNLVQLCVLHVRQADDLELKAFLPLRSVPVGCLSLVQLQVCRQCPESGLGVYCLAVTHPQRTLR